MKPTLKLFLRRNDYRCNFVFGLMNFNQVNFDLFVEYSLCGMQVARLEVPEVKVLPMLVVQEKKQIYHYESQDKVLDALRKMRLLTRGMTQGVWEKQTCEWIRTEVIPCFEVMTSALSWHLSDSYINSGVLNARSGDYFSGLMTVLKDAIGLQIAHRHNLFKSKRTAYSQFSKCIEDWELRLGSQSFHGGDQPDQADFLMFAVLGCYQMKMKAMLREHIRTQLWQERLVKLVDTNQA